MRYYHHYQQLDHIGSKRGIKMKVKRIFFFGLIAVVSLAVLVVTINQTLNLAKKQNLGKKAATAGGTATLSFNPATKSIYAGESLPIEIKISTPNASSYGGIIGIQAVITYTNPSAVVLTEADIQTPLTLPWSYVHKQIVRPGTILINAIHSTFGGGYQGAVSVPQTFAILNFKGASSSQAVTNVGLSLNQTSSEIRSKSGNQDILSASFINGSYTVLVDATAPDTSIVNGPTGILQTAQAVFIFTGSDTPSPPAGTPTSELTYSHRLDSNPWSAFSTNATTTLTGFFEGAHVFEVKAKDKAGNIDATPAVFSFTYTPVSNLNLRIKFQGLSSTSRNYPKEVDVKVKNAGYDSGVMKATAVYNSEGYYTAAISLPTNFPAGTNTYQLFIKGPSHLQKRFDNVSLIKNTDNLVQKISPPDELTRGDVTNDNVIMMNDITAIISNWKQSETLVTASTQKFDLTEDGNISQTDITAIISNWTASEVRGE